MTWSANKPIKKPIKEYGPPLEDMCDAVYPSQVHLFWVKCHVCRTFLSLIWVCAALFGLVWFTEGAMLTSSCWVRKVACWQPTGSLESHSLTGATSLGFEDRFWRMSLGDGTVRMFKSTSELCKMLHLYLRPSFMRHLAECHRFTPKSLKSLKLPGHPQSKLGLAMRLYLLMRINRIR